MKNNDKYENCSSQIIQILFLYLEMLFFSMMMSLNMHMYISAVRCHYKAVQYKMILHTSPQGLMQSIDQSLNPQKTSHILP